MPQPKFLHQRGDTYYVRRPIPLDLQPLYGRKEIWRSLRTASRREAENRSHGVLAELATEFGNRRRERNAAQHEHAFLASDEFSHAAHQVSRTLDRMGLPNTSYVPADADVSYLEFARIAGIGQERPRSRAEALRPVDHALAELDRERASTSLIESVDEDGEPAFKVPTRFAGPLQAALDEMFEAERQKLEAQRTIIAGQGKSAEPAASKTEGKGGLPDLMVLWKAQRKPADKTELEMRTALARFERVNGPLAYADISDEHARRFKADLLADATIRNATRAKQWSMLRALIGVAVDDRLLEQNPFARVKLKLEDDSTERETLTIGDLQTLFGRLSGDEWWLARIGLYTGARLGEICQLTKTDLKQADGAWFLHIRPDEAAGKRVKTRSSVRQVPLHEQLIHDGILAWIEGRPGDSLSPWTSAVASKRILRRMRDAGLGEGKVFHSLRHTFKAAARTVMGEEWHDRLTGHVSGSVGRTYGDYRNLKRKIDLIEFGIEAHSGIVQRDGAVVAS